MSKNRSGSLTSEDELLQREIGQKRKKGGEEHEESTPSSVSSDGNHPQLQASPASGSGAEKHAGSPASSYLEMDVALNRDLFVAVNEVINKESGEKTILLGVSNVRPQTHLGGNKQGDHVTAYIAYLHMLITAVEGESVQEAANIIVEAAKAILPDKAAVFDDLFARLQPAIDSVVTRNERRELINGLKAFGKSQEHVEKINEALKRDKRAVFMDITRQIAEKFLKEVNLDEEVAFARVGESESAAGEREKKAIHTLKVINEIEGIKGSGNQEQKFDRIYKQCIKTSSPYIRGINTVLGNKVVSEIRKKWEDVKEWDAIIEKREGWEEKRAQLVRIKLNDRFAQNFTEHTDEEAVKLIKTQLVNELKQMYDDRMYTTVSSSSTSRNVRSTSSSSSIQAQSNPKVDLVSKCFGDLFDFKYENHKKEEDPQDILFRVTARHIISMFRAFKELAKLDENVINNIIYKFLDETVLISQKWNESEIESGGLTVDYLGNRVTSKIDMKDVRMLPKEEKEEYEKGVPKIEQPMLVR